jgi:hypothetical protein
VAGEGDGERLPKNPAARGIEWKIVIEYIYIIYIIYIYMCVCVFSF